MHVRPAKTLISLLCIHQVYQGLLCPPEDALESLLQTPCHGNTLIRLHGCSLAAHAILLEILWPNSFYLQNEKDFFILSVLFRHIRKIRLPSKIKPMRSLVTSTFLHACEIWTLTAELVKIIQTSDMRCYYKQVNILNLDHFTNAD